MYLAWSHKSFEKVSSSGSGLPQISSAAERKNKFRFWKILLQSFRSAIFFHSLYMRSLHYARLFFSGVVDIINGPRHQLIINKAQTPLGPRPSNFCIVTIIYSSSPPLLFSPRFWEPRDPPQPGFFLEARDNPGKEVGGVIEFSDGLLTLTLG